MVLTGKVSNQTYELGGRSLIRVFRCRFAAEDAAAAHPPEHPVTPGHQQLRRVPHGPGRRAA